MKKLIFLAIFSCILYANYNQNVQGTVQIDMHGGKKDKLVNKFQPFSNKSLKDIKKPIKPIVPLKPTVKETPKNLK